MEKKLLSWRVQVISGQSFCYFDPSIERLVIIPLTASERSAIVQDMVSCEAVENEDERSINKEGQLLLELPTVLSEGG